MDYKDILVIIFVIAITIFVGKFLPNNPLSILVDYLKKTFKSKA